MRQIFTIILALLGVVVYAETPAFPGAEGGGMYATGGRGGKIYHVTNLNDSGTGSLRAAVEASGARIVVFDVSGVIDLKSQLKISNGNITIAGQTAPGDGICLKGRTTYIGANNVIIRFIHFRLGDERASEMTGGVEDATWGRNQENIIIDHCSMSWSMDECASFYDNTDFTMQWCILGESLRMSYHEKDQAHGYCGIWGGTNASFHHNMLIHHDSRNPRMCGPRYRTHTGGDAYTNIAEEVVDLRNCVLYNWGNNSGYAGEGGRYNFVNNYYKPGPATKTSSNVNKRIFEPYAYNDDGGNIPYGTVALLYVSGNYMDGQGENWDINGIHPNANSQTTFYYTQADGSISVASTTAPTAEMVTNISSQFTGYTESSSMTNIETDDAITAYEKVLGYAGACVVRDAVDARYVNEAKGGYYTYTGSNGSTNGLIDTQSDVGGWPAYNTYNERTDSDNDGMPDDWEKENNLDPNKDDSANYDLDSEYTNIEVYINSLVQDIMDCKATDINTDEDYNYSYIAESTKWDFTTWSTETINNLNADLDANWAIYKNDANRFQNNVEMSGNLEANGVAIAETDGLSFGTCKSGSIMINTQEDDNNPSLQIGTISMTIPSCRVGDKITITYASANASEERGWTITSGGTTIEPEKTIEKTEYLFEVTSPGSVTLTAVDNQLRVYSIDYETVKVNSATPKITTDPNAELISTRYFTIDGREHLQPVRGINIVVDTYSDGTRKTKKFIQK